jgi:pSer/pThr/pTyr-binding forkhead associated (FHA) protein
MGSILFKAISGMLAGLVAWAMVEPFKPNFSDDVKWAWFERMLMFAWAICLGATIGFVSGYQRGSKTHALKECGLSALFALIGIMTFKAFAGPFAAMIALGGPMAMIGRTGAIALIGAGLGLGIGYSSFVWRRGLQGMIGGVIGGAIAGALFDAVGAMTSGVTLTVSGVQTGHVGEVGALPRALTSILMCGAIALMIGIIEALMRSAWLRLELGRNEGKEWVLDKAAMLLGRFERADIPLFGDQSVAPQHAVIHKQGGTYTVVDQGSPIGIGVNGQRVQQAVLSNGDVLQIGSFRLVFQMRNSKAPNRGPEPNRGTAYPIGGQQPYGGQQPVQPAAASSQLMTPSQMAMQQQQQPMQPTMMNPTMANPAMQPTMMVPQQQPYGQMDPTVAVPAQGQFQPTVAVQTGATLVATDGPLAGQRFPLNMPIDLGRECQQVPMAYDTSASRKHARIEPSGMFVNVTDLGSTNGTFVNGQRVTNAIAKNGDIVKVGATNFRIES